MTEQYIVQRLIGGEWVDYTDKPVTRQLARALIATGIANSRSDSISADPQRWRIVDALELRCDECGSSRAETPDGSWVSMNTITLFRSRGSWIARFGGPHAYEVIRLLGTCEIPTPFTDVAEAGTVAYEISLRNPGVTVVTV